MKLILTIEFEYDEGWMYSDEEGKEWFFNILRNDPLGVISQEVGDNIGTMKVLSGVPENTLGA